MADTNERTPLLKVEHLSKEFPAESGMFAKRFSKRVVSAVNDISFEIYPGETFGLVGESGCGKSTTGRTIMRLTKPTAGKVFFQGKDVSEMSKHEIKDMRREMQFIFQDPYASLNPRMTIGEIVSEPMTIHGVGTKEERIERVRELLDVVGLNPAWRGESAPVRSGPEPAEGASGQVWYSLPLHRSRPLCRAAHLRPCCRYVPGQDGRGFGLEDAL